MMPRKPSAVREAAPVQVYLDREGQDRLERLAAQLELSKSEVLRRGLDALERAVSDPSAHPALRLIGMAEGSAGRGLPDPAREHDRVLADEEERAWGRRAR
jgi:hypothetical protein